MTELEKRLIGELTNFAEQYAKDQKRLTEQVVRLAAQYAQDQKRLTGQVERLEEDMRQFTRQYVKDQRRVVERMKAMKRLTGQVERFEMGTEGVETRLKEILDTKQKTFDDLIETIGRPGVPEIVALFSEP